MGKKSLAKATFVSVPTNFGSLVFIVILIVLAGLRGPVANRPGQAAVSSCNDEHWMCEHDGTSPARTKENEATLK